MPDTKLNFDQLSEIISNDGIAASLEFLANDFRAEEKYYELFEVLKMQVRNSMNLPLTYEDSVATLDEDQQRQLEDGLFDACRSVGTLLMKAGRPGEGWTFLRPLADVDTARELLQSIEVDDENVDSIIEVALQERVSPAYGFKLLLDRYGTCNSITTFDAEVMQCELPDRREAAGLLVEHLYGELVENLRADIERREEKAPPENASILELVKDRPELFEDNAYHIDTTHLSSVIRIARMLEDQRLLGLAVDMTEYASRLSDQYHYEGDAPFTDIYPSTRLYLNALLGNDVDEALAYFEEKARSEEESYYGPIGAETYIDLLKRVGRLEEAIEKSIEFLPDGPKAGIAPPAFELCKRSGNFDRLMEFCREKGDQLGFAMCVLHKAEKNKAE